MRRFWSILVASALLALGACSEDPAPEVASAGGATPPPAAGSADGPADDPYQRELQFVSCMRDEGVDMPDPVPGDTSGRSALLEAIDGQGMGSDPDFQAALDACGDYLPPQEPPTPPSSEDLARLTEWVRCLRDNGMPDLPDPDPATGRLHIFFYDGLENLTEEELAGMGRDGYYAFDADDQEALAAIEACREYEVDQSAAATGRNEGR